MQDEIRKDIFERSVIIATSRSKRPGAFIDKKDREKACPFCPGSESKTEKTILALPDDNKWKVRIFKNKFPVLYKKHFKQIEGGFYPTFTPCGSHEILVETPFHDREYFNMNEKDIMLIIEALKKRHSDLMELEDVNYVAIFKNKGVRAGASLPHPHMQIIAAPLFPSVISKEMHESEDFFKKEKECGNCIMIRNELRERSRIITHNNDWVVLCPFVSTWPYQATILPRRHFSDISEISGDEALNLSKLIKKLFHGYSKLLNDPPYNIMYHNFPDSDFWHFHIHVYPRLVTHAGFEFFGLNVNIASPEKSASELKGAITGSRKADRSMK
jgi:UDPglucose--hexose-1-phosphate uridylyltransferase